MNKNKGKSVEELLQEASVPVEEQPYPIPENWVWVRLSDCLEKVEYGYTESSSLEEIGPHFLRITDIQDDNVDWGKVPYCKIPDDSLDKYTLQHNDIVVARTGATTGKSFLIKQPPKAVFASYLIRLRANKLINPQYLWTYMKSSTYWNQITVVKKGSAQPGANASILGKLVLPLPPLKEQLSIVDKVESLINKINQAKQLIEEAKETFELRRATILDKAFRGVLTERWRGSKKKKLVVNLNSKLPFEEHPYSLPMGWKWTYLDEVCEKITDGTHHSPESFSEGDYKYITAKNIKEKGMELQNITYVSSDVHRAIYSRCDVKYRDVLYIKDGATTGVATINNLMEEFSLLSSVGLLRTKEDVLLPEYLMYCLNSPSMKQRMLGLMSGIAIRRLTLTKIKKGIIPVPPIEEQQEIVNMISGLFKLEERGIDIIDIQKLDLISQSLLAKALRGELGTNESTDESAASLLINSL